MKVEVPLASITRAAAGRMPRIIPLYITSTRIERGLGIAALSDCSQLGDRRARFGVMLYGILTCDA